jgi:hypothetical protein
MPPSANADPRKARRGKDILLTIFSCSLSIVEEKEKTITGFIVFTCLSCPPDRTFLVDFLLFQYSCSPSASSFFCKTPQNIQVFLRGEKLAAIIAFDARRPTPAMVH